MKLALQELHKRYIDSNLIAKRKGQVNERR